MHLVTNTVEIADQGPVIPVIVIDDAASAVDLAHALIAGGIRVLEITLRTTVAFDAIGAVAQAVPRAIVGAGTVRTPDDAARARDVGASFAVSPGFSPTVADACDRYSLPLLPGVATAGEVMTASEAGFSFMKFFPAQAAGGVPLLSALASPFADVSFCPTGGIGPGNAASYLSLPNVRCIGGSWIVPADAIAANDWPRITQLASAASQLSGEA
ncbi:MAG: bifunctional 4-hydroxy-2-oxoglutarate aldolase/2-dehydro-3-deoxy-phosphogluconate aldolase [Burkholderiaceae bacterium]